MRALLVAIAAVLWLGAGVAAAQSPEQKARAHHAEGLEHYEAGRYDEAIASYRRAYALIPAPGILFNLAQAHRLAGHCAEALELYRRYAREQPEAANAPVANEHAAQMQACLDRKPAAPPETGAAEPAPPMEAEPQPVESSRPLPSAPLPSAPADAGTPGRGKKLAGLGIAAGGALALGAGLYFGLDARSASSDLDEFFASGGVWGPEQQALEDRGERSNGLMIGFTALGTAAVVAGAVTYILGTREAEASSAAGLSVHRTGGGAAVLWTARY